MRGWKALLSYECWLPDAATNTRHASLHFQPVNEPASGRAGRMFLQVHRLHGKTGPDVVVHRHVQRNQFSRCEIFLDHWLRHITPPCTDGTAEGEDDVP